jgi:AcrR family transcriptional regulator
LIASALDPVKQACSARQHAFTVASVPKPKRPGTKSKPKPKAKARPEEGALGDRRRLDLLEAAYELTAEKGLAGLRTRDVAARAKVNISTLHYYFGTKQALLEALVNFTTGKFADPSLRKRPGWAHSALSAHLGEAWSVFETEPQLEIVLEELNSHSRHATSSRASFRGVYQGWNAAVEQLLREEVAARRVRSDLDPKLGAFIVTCFIIGASVELGVDPRAFDYSAVALELERWTSRAPRAKG